jgi:hypothetical protein
MHVMTDDAPGAAVSSPWLGKNDDGAASRLLIAGAVLVATVWIFVVALVRPGSFWLQTVLRLVPMLLALAALSAFAVSSRGFVRSSEPPRFVVREGVAFVVPASRAFAYFVVGEVLMLGLLAGMAIFQWSNPAGGNAGFAVIDYAFTGGLSVLAVALGGLVAPMVVIALGGRPRVELTSRAMVLREPMGSRTIPWDALRPGLPAWVGGWQTLTLTVDRPELVVRSGLTWRSAQVPMAYLRVSPSFLADAIRYYVDHPDRRDAVGLRAEHERLLTDLDVSVGQ